MTQNLLLLLLILAYLSTLAMSTGHLAQWYALTLGGLPPWLAWGLAASLEFTAFLLSLLSNSVLRGSAWAGGGALAALALVWMGNALSMHRGAPGVPLWETLAMSLFVPVGTYVVGKVVGEMLRVRPVQEGWNPGVRKPAPRSEHPLLPAEQDPHLAERLPPIAERATEQRPLVHEQNDPFAERLREEPERALHPLEREARVRLSERKVETERSLELEVDERGLAILNALRSANAPLSLSELSRRTGIPKSTVHAKLNALAEAGVVVRSEEGWTLKEGSDA